VQAKKLAIQELLAEIQSLPQGASLHDSTFSRAVWRLYGGAKGLVVWYYQGSPEKDAKKGEYVAAKADLETVRPPRP
jgi:hypothetical protein